MKIKPPSKDELLRWNNVHEAAEFYDVTSRTITNWMKKYNIWQPKKNFGCNKIDLSQAEEIRRLYCQGMKRKDLAIKFSVTQATIGRIVNNITHKPIKGEFSDVSVVYNPSSDSATKVFLAPKF